MWTEMLASWGNILDKNLYALEQGFQSLAGQNFGPPRGRGCIIWSTGCFILSIVAGRYISLREIWAVSFKNQSSV